MLKKSNETTIKQFNKKFCDQKNPEKNFSLQHISHPITSYINMVSTAFARQIL